MKAGGLRPGFDYEPKHYAAGAEVSADWADRALGKAKRWESWGHGINSQHQKHYPTGQEVPPPPPYFLPPLFTTHGYRMEVSADWEGKSAVKASKWDEQYSSYHGTANNEELFQPNNPVQPPPPRPPPGLQVHSGTTRTNRRGR